MGSTAAAAAAGIGERTVFRWLQEDGFSEAYRKARSSAVRQAVTQIQASMGAAVKALLKIISDTKAPAASRVQAARIIIETGIKAVELEEIESRLSAVEKAQKKGY